MAAVGLADTAPSTPLATVVSSARVAAGRLVEVGWNASQLAILEQHGPVRALLPLSSRAYDLRRGATGTLLRRRDDGGSWQPVADSLASVDLSFGLAAAAEGGRPLWSATELRLPVEIAVARVECAADSGGTLVRAVQWATTGRR